MDEPKIIITMKGRERFKVMQDVQDERITGLQAAEILGLTNVHVSRLKKRLKSGGFESLVRKPSIIPPNKKVSDEQLKKIIKLRKDLYFDFNINHFKEKLNEKHNISYCYTTIRDILIKAGLHSSKKKKIVHRIRRRMPKAGMLVQMDIFFIKTYLLYYSFFIFLEKNLLKIYFFLSPPQILNYLYLF